MEEDKVMFSDAMEDGDWMVGRLAGWLAGAGLCARRLQPSMCGEKIWIQP